MSGARQFEIPDEHILEIVRVVLTRPNERELDVGLCLEHLENAAGPDQVRADAESEHDVAHQSCNIAARTRPQLRSAAVWPQRAASSSSIAPTRGGSTYPAACHSRWLTAG